MIEVITIRCFVCKRVVDKVRVDRDENRAAYRFEVACHGETDVCHITDYFIAHADAAALKDLEGVAFAPTGVALPAQPKALTHVG